jgi:hypothetical protein
MNTNTSIKSDPMGLADFAFKKQGPLDAGVNALLNIVITWFMLGGVASVPVISPPGSEFSKSLLGTLVPPAVIIAFAISILTTKITVGKRVKGEVLPPLKAGTPWLKRALWWGLFRSVINVLVVYGVGGIIIQFAPGAEVSRATAAATVGLIAGLLAYVEAVTAVLRTPNAQSPVALPPTTE